MGQFRRACGGVQESGIVPQVLWEVVLVGVGFAPGRAPVQFGEMHVAEKGFELRAAPTAVFEHFDAGAQQAPHVQHRVQLFIE